MATSNDLKNGMVLNIDGQLWSVVEFQHVKPGKGGAFVRTKLRNLRNGNLLEKTFNAGIKVEQAILEKRDMQFLYKDGSDFVFMDQESYDQSHVSPAALGEAADVAHVQVLEALRQAWREKRMTSDDLWRYAKVCRVANVMRPYLEAIE